MKHLKQLTQGLFFVVSILLIGCSTTETVKPACLPNQFPFGEDAYVTASYNSNNKLVALTYKFEEDVNTFQSIRSYDTKGRILQINFYVNRNLADDFVKISYLQDTVKEEYYRSSVSASGLMSYRYYYLDENEKVISYSERFKENLFERSDSVVFTYTNENITNIVVYNEDNVIEETYTLTYDTNTSPYYKSAFAGDEYLYSFLNLSVNNPLTITHVELAETTNYTYTYSENKGFPLTRLLSTETTAGEFKYTCDNP
jgi:hypothetical protein